MNAQVEEKVLSECGHILSARRSHATEYKNKDIIIYTVDISSLNLIINPEDYVFIIIIYVKPWTN